MTVTYRRDSAGTRDVLITQCADLVADAAATIAAQLPPDLDVVVDSYTTDRAAAAVTIREPQALLLEARDGLLTRAAAAAGLEVRSRG